MDMGNSPIIRHCPVFCSDRGPLNANLQLAPWSRSGGDPSRFQCYGPVRIDMVAWHRRQLAKTSCSFSVTYGTEPVGFLLPLFVSIKGRRQ